MPFVAELGVMPRHTGRHVGESQHCVAFVRHVTGAPATSHWREGARARDSQAEPGTAIAAFDASGRYGNHTDGRSHAAILIEQTGSGLLVWDQWVGHPVSQRTIRWKNGDGPACDDGDRFAIIEPAA
jgi:hypothetical protein